MQPGPALNFGGAFKFGASEDQPGAAAPFVSKRDNDTVESDAPALPVLWSSPLFQPKEKEGAALTAENLKKSSLSPFDAPAFNFSEGLIKAAQPQPQAVPAAVPSFLAGGNSFGVFGNPALQPEDSYTSAISTSMSRQTSFQSLDDDKQPSKFGSMRPPSSLGGSQEALSPFVLADNVAQVEEVSQPESEELLEPEPELPAVEPPAMLTPGGSSVAVYARHRALAALAEMSCDAETVMPLASQPHNATADDGQEEIFSVRHKLGTMPAKGSPSDADLGFASEEDDERYAINPPPMAPLAFALDEDKLFSDDCVASLGNSFNPLHSEAHVAKPTPVTGKLDFNEVRSPLSEANMVPDEQLGMPSPEVEGLAPSEQAELEPDSPLLDDGVVFEEQGEYEEEEGLAMQMSLRQNYDYEYGHDETARGIQELEERLREAELNAEEEAYRADEALARCARLTQEIACLKTKLELAEKLASDAEADSDYARHADRIETLQEMDALRAENRSLRASLQQLQKSAEAGARQLALTAGGHITAPKHARAASCDTFQPPASPSAARLPRDPWNIDADTQQRDRDVERKWIDGELRGSAGFNPLFAGKLMQRQRKMDGSSKN